MAIIHKCESPAEFVRLAACELLEFIRMEMDRRKQGNIRIRFTKYIREHRVRGTAYFSNPMNRRFTARENAELVIPKTFPIERIRLTVEFDVMVRLTKGSGYFAVATAEDEITVSRKDLGIF